MSHLQEVAAFVERWSDTESVIAAAWLHYKVEDRPPTLVAELVSLFGKDLADIFAELADEKLTSIAPSRYGCITCEPNSSISCPI